MTTYYTSDLHLGHVRIIELAHRPFRNAEHMNSALIANWNGVVQPDDHVYVLGDLCMGTIVDSLQLVGELNGHIHLVAGNHDRMHPAYPHKREARYQEFFDAYIAAGVEDIHTGNQIARHFVDGILVNLSHFPYEGDSTYEDRYDEHRPINFGFPLLHGHVHDAWKVRIGTEHDPFAIMVNVGVDVHGYTPVSEDEIARLIRTPRQETQET